MRKENLKKEELLAAIKNVEFLGSCSKLQRLLTHPLKYSLAIIFREWIYKKTKEAKEVSCKTFFGRRMQVLLPAATDIYITGGKSHDSEVRLAKFLVHNLNYGDVFLDVGAHYGYFTLLGSVLTGESGRVFAFEASPVSHRVLKKNTERYSNITAKNLAVSDKEGSLTFYEFPNLYSEYNSMDITQFENESWFELFPPGKISICTLRLDSYLEANNIFPKAIKIDVEGAEYKVVAGMENFLKYHSPVIIMEYLSEQRGNKAHRQAEALLKQWNYLAYAIDTEGKIFPLESTDVYMKIQSADSDNIVYCRK